MTRTNLIKMIVMFSLIILIGASDITDSAVNGQKCANDAATNKAIVDSIYKQIRTNKNLAAQISHINITSTNLAVKIEGWADKKRDYDKIVQIALRTNCVRVLNVNNFQEEKPTADRLSAGCSSGTKKCGDICIPENDICNISGDDF